MKKLLMIILCVSVVTPSFAFADKGSDNEHRERERIKIEDSRHRSSDQVLSTSSLIVVTPVASIRIDDSVRNINGVVNGRDDERKNKEIKLRYFFCSNATGGTLVAVNERDVKGNRSRWPAEIRGCVKLSGGFAKKLQRMTSVPVATTTPPTGDVIAPTISLLSVSSITPTSATISWTTNEVADGEVYIGTNNPVKSGIFRKVENKTLSTAHSFTLTGLNASTTYFYVVESRDASRNKVESAQQSFVTPATPVLDTIAPVISGVATSASSTTATVSWNTNELTNATLKYGTSTSSMTTLVNPAFTLPHTFALTGLTASTTYSLILESADQAGNTATTTSTLITTN